MMTELDQSSGEVVSGLSRQENQDLRDQQTADQQLAAVRALQAQMSTKKQAIQAEIDQMQQLGHETGHGDFHANLPVSGYHHSDREYGRRPGFGGRR